MEGTDSKKMFIETGETGKAYINFSSQKSCLSVLGQVRGSAKLALMNWHSLAKDEKRVRQMEELWLGVQNSGQNSICEGLLWCTNVY